jgi:hypothetical protein
MRKFFIRAAAGAAVLAVGAYLAALAYLYLTQQRQVFPGKATDSAVDAALLERYPQMREIEYTTPDGAILTGRLLARPDSAAGPKGAPLVLYFGGNADVSEQFLLDAPEDLPGCSIAALDYRGYGESTGVASEAALKADALLIYDRLTAASGEFGRTGRSGVVVMGRSLGTALAAHVAANREVAALVLVTPFDSIRAVGQERHPLIPVGLLLKNPFDVLPDAARVTAPTLVLIAASDATVPPEHARRLAAAWHGPLKTVTLAGDHDTILTNSDYWPTIRNFLRENGAEPK